MKKYLSQFVHISSLNSNHCLIHMRKGHINIMNESVTIIFLPRFQYFSVNSVRNAVFGMCGDFRLAHNGLGASLWSNFSFILPWRLPARIALRGDWTIYTVSLWCSEVSGNGQLFPFPPWTRHALLCSFLGRHNKSQMLNYAKFQSKFQIAKDPVCAIFQPVSLCSIMGHALLNNTTERNLRFSSEYPILSDSVKTP